MKSDVKKLPSKEYTEIIDVSMKHVFLGISLVFFGTIITGSSIICIRDYSRYRRQKAILQSTMQLIHIIKGKEEIGKT